MTLGRSIGTTQRRNARALGVALVVLAGVQAAAGPTSAVPQGRPAGAKAATPAGADEERLAAEIARAITAHLPSAPAAGAACDANTHAAVKSAVEAVIEAANTTPAIAVKAIDLARGQPAALDACRDGALVDAATESAGSGEVVDDADVQRGFTLYTGPWPPPPRATLVSEMTQTAPVAPPTQVAAKVAARQKHGRRNIEITARTSTPTPP